MVVITPAFASSARNLGNKLFTYAVSKIIADSNNYALSVPFNSHIQRNGIISDFPYNSNVGIIIDNPEYYVSDHSMLELGIEKIIEASLGKKTLMDGYFIKYEYVKNYKNNILQLYSDLFGNFDGKNDIILLLRDSNCDSTFKLPDEYYIDLINQSTFDNLYVSLDHIHKHQSLLKKIEKHNPIILDLPILDLFKLITTKKTIIACQGTFSFWSCWLSNAEKIYWPITSIGPNSLTDKYVNLYVDDDPRYQQIYLK